MTLPFKTFYIDTVGCKVNQVEAELLANQFEQAGWQQVAQVKDARLVLVHTCTVTRRADRDSRRKLGALHAQNPSAALAVSGCLAEMESETFQNLPGEVIVIRQAGRSEAVIRVAQVLGIKQPSVQPSLSSPPGFFGRARNQNRARALIKIQDGCNGACTYCRVRLARGPSLSRALKDIVSEAQDLIAQGFQELVLTGVNLGSWQPNLADLLAALANLPGHFRLRLSSLEPQHLTPQLMSLLPRFHSRICPHLHLPFQSGEDTVLAAMRRTYTANELKAKLTALRAAWPELVLTGDVIVGFPGETPAAFEKTCQWVKENGFIRLHVFPFSARPGTEALRLPDQWPAREITRRARYLRNVSRQLTEDFYPTRIGKKTVVLLEQTLPNGEWLGTTETYLKARIRTSGPAGRLAAGYITGQSQNQLLVEVEQKCERLRVGLNA